MLAVGTPGLWTVMSILSIGVTALAFAGAYSCVYYIGAKAQYQ